MSAQEVRHMLSSITRRLNDIQTFQLPRLRTCVGPVDLHRELVEEMRDDLEGVRYNLEVAREMSESLSRTEREVSTTIIDQMEREYANLKRAYREAMLESKRAIAANRNRTHELSLRANQASTSEIAATDTKSAGDKQGAGTGAGAKGKARSAAEFGMGGDDELQTKTNEVTTALRRTTALMQTELERSVLSVQMLDSSSQTMRSTNSLYTRYSQLLETSSALVKTLEKADYLDRILILCALLFFLLVVGFIIKRRVLDRTVGVVLGGVGRGVGWYLFGTTRLVKLAFGGSATPKSPSAIDSEGRAQLEDGLGIAEEIGSGAALPQPGADSAIGGESVSDFEAAQGEGRVIDVAPDPAPAGTPYVEPGAEHYRQGPGGRVEISPHPDSIPRRDEL